MQPAHDQRFEFDKADRLTRALRVSGVGVGEMADYLEVSRNAVSSWINGRNNPRDRDLKQFALKTGFPLEWLRDGDVPPMGPNGTKARASGYNVGGSRLVRMSPEAIVTPLASKQPSAA